ncbi:hypothetical protein KDL01_31885 [Actinospica durhamensis]|uniref:Uncharacterized protein n=1 Tax=Actinospica durhamensis TaxID=1508375 RepID=A0A941EWX8_9ACTN|nr:hypothetical protein [Actinospica durhamensis]MBR7837918.1 hypothetical protein [Actinospica durhamensis]
MRHDLSSSNWSVRSGGPDHNLTTLMYVRDAAGLAAPTDYPLPPLAPAVPRRAELAPHATADAAEAWVRWWDKAVLSGSGRRFMTPDGLVPQPVRPEPGTDLRALYDAVADEAREWIQARYTEFYKRMHVRQATANTVGKTVKRLERELGRPSAPFDLTVRLLPLDRRWGRRMDVDLVVVSESLWFDEDACDLFFERVVRTLM